MKKGVLDMLVLKLLSEDEKYGYQIISELRDRSRERFLLKEGTLYPILYRLEEDGLVESRWSGAEGRKVPRKYYHISGHGPHTGCPLNAGICVEADRTDRHSGAAAGTGEMEGRNRWQALNNAFPHCGNI